MGRCWVCLAAALAAGILGHQAVGAEAGGVTQEHLVAIARAGNAREEKERYRVLAELRDRPSLPDGLRADLGRLLPIVDQWANGREKAGAGTTGGRAENGYLCLFLRNWRTQPPPIAQASPLYPLWCFYRARMLIWPVIQSGNLRHNEELRARMYGEARQLLAVARKAYPDNPVIGMYLNEPIPWPKEYRADPNAPEWANLQREGIEKLADVIHFWADERQLDSGEFGGGWGDDVEMWRWWAPILIGFDDPKVTASQERLSNGMFAQPHMAQGYTLTLTDVEHSAEDTKDTIVPMLHLRPDDPVWRERAMRLAVLMEKLWTGRNERGHLMFRSTYFTAERVDPTPQRACDTVYHPWAVLPAMIVWQRTNDSRLTRLFTAWMDTWADATAREERGKPAGIIPSAIHWPSGQVGGLAEPWWDPRNHSEPTLYRWPSAMANILSSLLLAYHMTRDEKYLQPLVSMARIRLEYLAKPQPQAEPGSAAWCAARMGFLAPWLAKYRLLTGDKRFDELLLREADGYVKFRLTGDRAALTADLRHNAEAFRSNWEAYTTEMRWTDRVIVFANHYLNDFQKPPHPRPQPGLLLGTITGDPGRPDLFPTNAVRWLTPPREIAALVTHHDMKALRAELYHFGDAPRPMAAELYLLDLGGYTATLSAEGRELWTQKLTVEGPRTPLRFQLPPRTLCQLAVAANPSTPGR